MPSNSLRSIHFGSEIYLSLNDLILFFIEQGQPNSDVTFTKNGLVQMFTKYKIDIEAQNNSSNINESKQSEQPGTSGV